MVEIYHFSHITNSDKDCFRTSRHFHFKLSIEVRAQRKYSLGVGVFQSDVVLVKSASFVSLKWKGTHSYLHLV